MAESNIGFEEKIWKAACVLRGNMDASCSQYYLWD